MINPLILCRIFGIFACGINVYCEFTNADNQIIAMRDTTKNADILDLDNTDFTTDLQGLNVAPQYIKMI